MVKRPKKKEKEKNESENKNVRAHLESSASLWALELKRGGEEAVLHAEQLRVQVDRLDLFETLQSSFLASRKGTHRRAHAQQGKKRAFLNTKKKTKRVQTTDKNNRCKTCRL